MKAPESDPPQRERLSPTYRFPPHGAEVIRYANILRALRECFEAEKHDRDAYGHFGDAMDAAMRGARAAANAFLHEEIAERPIERGTRNLERRRKRTSEIYADGLRASLSKMDGDALPTEDEILRRAEGYSLIKVRG